MTTNTAITNTYWHLKDSADSQIVTIYIPTSNSITLLPCFLTRKKKSKMKISILFLTTIVLFISCCDSKPVFLLGASGVIPAIVLEGGLATTLGTNLT